jgi:hypothetical protein
MLVLLAAIENHACVRVTCVTCCGRQ